MNIQIFGKNKCFDTKKAERYFKERRIKYQMVDLIRYGLSGKEFDAVLRGIGGVDRLIDWESKNPEVTLMKYMDDVCAKEDKVFELAEKTAGRKLAQQMEKKAEMRAAAEKKPSILEQLGEKKKEAMDHAPKAKAPGRMAPEAAL